MQQGRKAGQSGMGPSSIEPNIRNASKKSYNSGNIKVNDSLLQTTHKHLAVPSGT